ncbi:unnamed protein product, partial [Discosporangium mesarthrocarpum]
GSCHVSNFGPPELMLKSPWSYGRILALICAGFVDISAILTTGPRTVKKSIRPEAVSKAARAPAFGNALPTLEFYSGIGGLRVALDNAGRLVGRKIAIAGIYEINTVANAVYEHNFPEDTVTCCSIEHLKMEDVDGVAKLWLMSPPCQPFCKVGKQMDVEDPRTRSLMHLVGLLEVIREPPKFVFLENVPGFENSRAQQRLVEVLVERGFDVEQYLLSPMQLGVPNSRLRYFCLATRHHDSLLPPCSGGYHPPLACGSGKKGRVYPDHSLMGDAATPLLVPPKAAAYATDALRFDVVTGGSTATTTFTKGYGKHAGRAGPVLLLHKATGRVSREPLDRFPSGQGEGEARQWLLRYFSDQEILRMHGFPEGFGFPDGVTLRQRFSLVGNSVNVEVVSKLLAHML